MQFLRRPLESTGWLMAALTAVFGVLMLVDPRLIEGAPAWLKPLKFAVSTGIYSLTLAWMLRFLPAWPRLVRRVALITASVFVVEVALIAVQAARGTISHFNTGSAVDGAIFSVMGLAIFTQTLAAAAVTVALWRQTFTDRAMGWALRLGMTLAVVGASVGGIMTQPTTAQLAQARESQLMPRSGAHTVGGPDGGPGLPATGWSTEHGDLRAPHFVGLHAMQVLPLVALLVTRRRRGREPVGGWTVIGAAVSYGALFAILLVQALLGQSLIAPTDPIASALVAWAAGTFAFALVAWRVTGAPLAARTALEIA